MGWGYSCELPRGLMVGSRGSVRHILISRTSPSHDSILFWSFDLCDVLTKDCTVALSPFSLDQGLSLFHVPGGYFLILVLFAMWGGWEFSKFSSPDSFSTVFKANFPSICVSPLILYQEQQEEPWQYLSVLLGNLSYINQCITYVLCFPHNCRGQFFLSFLLLPNKDLLPPVAINKSYFFWILSGKSSKSTFPLTG